MEHYHQLFALLIATCSLCYLMAASVTKSCGNYSYAHFGDVEIYSNCTYFKCDTIFCPNETDRCHVSKQSSNTTPTVLVRTNICYSSSNEKLLESITEETIPATKKISLKVDTYRSGLSTSQESSYFTGASNEFHLDSEQIGEEIQRTLDIHLSGVRQNVQSEINKVNEQLQQQMKEMRQQMSNTFRNIFS